MADIAVYVGETHDTYVFNWTLNGVPVDLTGATVTARLRNQQQWTTSAAATGTIQVANATGGVVNYTFSAADVATAGNWDLQFKATYANGSVEFSRLVSIVISQPV